VLHERGEQVTGSDKAVSIFSQELESLGISVRYGHQAENVKGADLVVVSSAVPTTNIELEQARASGIPILRRDQFLPEIIEGQEVIAVAGTHGKTTTTGLIAWLLSAAGRDPGFIVGGRMQNLGTNARAGRGKLFVIEADEYDRTFLGIEAEVALITNVEYDHPDCYPSRQDFIGAFQDFARLVQRTLIVCSDDTAAASLQPSKAVRWTYGIDQPADWLAKDIRPNQLGGSDFWLTQFDKDHGLMRTRLPGLHNVLNVVGALAALSAVGIQPADVRNALTEFQGMGRRFELVGRARDIVIVDDYAHHPTEIKATLAAARERFAGRTIWAVFQPHTYSRMRALAAELSDSFVDADHVLILEVFAAREQPDPEFTGSQVAKQIDHPDVHFLPTIQGAVDYLLGVVEPGSAVITLSAGDGNQVGTGLFNRLGDNAEAELDE
jgi:UDP-N-acetylmuramate--alanine ligase